MLPAAVSRKSADPGSKHRWGRSRGSWLWSPRALLGAFLVLTLGPAIALLWSGWLMLEKDRALLDQSMAERREAAADEAVATLRRSLSSLVGRLGQLELADGSDAAIVEFAGRGVRCRSGRLPFVPVVPHSPAALSDVFAKADRLEFAEGNVSQAISILEPLTRARDPHIQADACLRLARNYRRKKDLNAALGIYKRLEQNRDARLDGVPADLVAQRARCVLLAELKREMDLRREACALLLRLRAGYWQISRAVYDVHFEDAAAWCGDGSGRDLPAEALAETVAWHSERISSSPSAPGWASTVRGSRLVTVVWEPAGDQSFVLVAGPEYLEREWLAALQPLCRAQGVSAHLLGADAPPPSGTAVRMAAITNLPWTLAVAGAIPEQAVREFGARRRFLLTALALVALTVAAGVFFTARAVGREVALVQLQSDFVAAISHEFRTPLTSLRNLSEMFTDGRALDEGTRARYYQMLARATGRLERLVEGLLGFGRMEAGVQIYDKRPLDPAALAIEVVEEFRLEASAEGFDVVFEPEPSLPSIRADRDALSRALRNLLENAMKYSLNCRTIWLEVARDGRYVAFRVRDHGYGIGPREQKAILRKFVRGEAARVGGIKGTGVGLTIVRHVVEAHSGKLRIDSRVGEGSTFTILIPIAKAPGVEGAHG